MIRGMSNIGDSLLSLAKNGMGTNRLIKQNMRQQREKGLGYFGELKRPDKNISTELSIGVNIGGKEIELPTLVPTLTRNEIEYLLKGNEPTKEIIDKSIAHALERIRGGKSPFAGMGEQKTLDEVYGNNYYE